VDFRRRYARHFHDLNIAWLEEYFAVEPYDRIVLTDPQKNIIGLGGHILFARMDGVIVGTCALLKHSDRMYELAKLAVSPESRGHGVGRRLMQAALERAREQGAETVVLATSTKLVEANRLYESFGFSLADSSVIGPLPYQRETIVMALDL
jgi:predicted N-acetyltransferase YhbS